MADAALGQPPRWKARPDFAMPPKKAARFPRTARLLRHADFERVYKQGRRHFSASITVFYWPRPEDESRTPEAAPSSAPTSGLRVGFTVGRALGGAVQRNRMKRRLREAVRMTRPASGSCSGRSHQPKEIVADHRLRRATERSNPSLRRNRTKAVRESRCRKHQRSRPAESRKPEAGSRP